MNFLKKIIILGATIFGFASMASADVNTVAVGGYDAVSYHSGSPVRGSGNHTASYKGATYLFASEDNLKAFNKNPAKYAPAYGGYCAYGAAVGKKFVGDPTVWKIVDGTLYLNLNADVSKVWHKDISGNIKKADANWKTIANVAAEDL
ncbi:YHS domain-containing (seleno)protein [Kordiimonas sp. SCSIO 12610]|uniref:YHS domain-containing (seleno)protein n=1 Tax=Kordiimonas sp. SCSIO 12610 TaxID=2829597 RepID=UPI00210C52AD|nr:YHS domain-containing (seleno)protein [Kordiimonas sp. SCSIO 12610]UTW55358.1 YHS domain-containing protein [Kordiimonas sp. SCSIO 12610]